MQLSIIPQNFIATPIFSDEYIFGTSNLPKTILRTNGDWRDYPSLMEDQRKNGVESSACTTYNTIRPITILLEEKYGIADANYSERYIATLAGTTPKGNSPHKVAETIRTKGLIPDELLPFDEAVDSLEVFYQPIPDELKKEGKKWLNSWVFSHEWVFNTDTSLREKQERIYDALMLSPIGVSVQGWAEDNGVYVKSGDDNHWTTIVGAEWGKGWHVLDTYYPYEKFLSWDYDFGYAKRYNVEKNTQTNIFISLLQNIWK